MKKGKERGDGDSEGKRERRGRRGGGECERNKEKKILKK
jgi:hypothetical protein